MEDRYLTTLRETGASTFGRSLRSNLSVAEL